MPSLCLPGNLSISQPFFPFSKMTSPRTYHLFQFQAWGLGAAGVNLSKGRKREVSLPPLLSLFLVLFSPPSKPFFSLLDHGKGRKDHSETFFLPPSFNLLPPPTTTNRSKSRRISPIILSSKLLLALVGGQLHLFNNTIKCFVITRGKDFVYCMPLCITSQYLY